MPPNTSKVDRTTRWGNPFRIGTDAVHPLTGRIVQVKSAEIAVELFAHFLGTPAGAPITEAAHQDLRGRNLACWCKEGQPCHGDVLLRVANSVSLRRAA
jgi:hypothetical protein